MLAGGTTLLPGYRDRFENEIKTLAIGSTKTDINVYTDLHRKYAAWIGASMFASFSTFSDMCIKYTDYTDATDANAKGAVVLKKTIC